MIYIYVRFVFPVSIHATQPIVDTEPEVILQKGTRGVLPCRVDTTVVLLSWYKGPKLTSSQTIIIMDVETEHKFGDGYSTKQYDIAVNFSLIINEVGVGDNANFFCEVSELGTGSLYNNRTSVVVFGKFDISLK